MPTTLFLVATPIGNLKDITLRALEVLKQVDLIACEDTRYSGKLLKHYDINTKLLALHDHNESQCSKFICDQLQAGKNIALISDAGTPLISDPGYHLVKLVREQGYQVVPIPGACAAIAALSASSLPTDKFIFEGFLPAKNTQQIKYLQNLQSLESNYTRIFYEAPHRLIQTIDNMLAVFGSDRPIVIAKELTKLFETIYSGSISEVRDWLLIDPVRQKGEFVILVSGYKKVVKIKDGAEFDPEALKILKILSEELAPKQAAGLVSKITGINKKQLYQLLLDNKK